ncbi:MAG: Hsp70 family protein [Alphaproteobacteria bacterium]
MAQDRAVGLDFGTSNCVLGLAEDGAAPSAVRFRSGTNFPSILCFYQDCDDKGRDIVVGTAGQKAIETYLKLGSDCRLIQSIKSYVANPTFSETNIHGRRYAIEDLVATMLNDIRAEAEATEGPLGERVVSGRPVAFAGERSDEALGLTRLENAYRQAGFRTVAFETEPLAAAYYHVRALEHNEVCLVADLGGGTSDFSLVRFHPDRDRPWTEHLAHAGIGIAGNQLDFRIIEHVVAPRLGRETTYRSGSKDLPVPAHIYTSFQRWNELSMLKAGRTLRDLEEIRHTAADPAAIDCLIHVIEQERGYDLYQAVGQTKAALSSADAAPFRFDAGPLHIDETVTRDDFEAWIAEDVARIVEVMKDMLSTSNFRAADVGKVFMTGGTSFVPRIRQAFADVFGEERLGTGDEFVSVATGLALIARERGAGAGRPAPMPPRPGGTAGPL